MEICVVILMVNNIGKSIYNQLGGDKFALKTGVRISSIDNNSVRFKMPKNKSRANHFVVKFIADNIFNVMFMNYDEDDSVERLVKEEDKVAPCQLSTVVASFTGLK